ncbi:MAG TPA: HIT family protein [Anaerolineae bacterium]|nr:HIT family protein [Anaerolineae bacterium]
MDDECVFCAIVAGRAPASLVWRDDRAVAFMDIRPVNPGHLLVVPRLHAASLAELSPVVGAHLFQIAMRLAPAVRRSGVACEGIALFLADGRAAGQEVMHVHLHVLPRFRGDGFRISPLGSPSPDRAALDRIAAGILGALDG